jgi:hypothetical protein
LANKEVEMSGGLVAGSGPNFNNVSESAVLLAGNQVATFLDGDTSDTAAAFTASIDWGDGSTTTAGTVSGSNGSFTVTGGPHIYADEGQDTITTKVTRTADQQKVTMAGSVTVTEAELLSITAANLSGDPGKPINNVQVASFGTSYFHQVASDFIAVIDWGDGTVSAGTVSGGGGSFTVTGSHTYMANGRDTVRVTVMDDPPGTQSVTGQSTALIGVAPGIGEIFSTPESFFGSRTVATFSDTNTSDTAASFSASIDWGDGHTTQGFVIGSNGSFSVTGSNTYADEGTFTTITKVTRTADNEQVEMTGSAFVTEADSFTATSLHIALTARRPFTGVVANFTNSFNGVIGASDLTTTIDWGDGTTTTGTVSGPDNVNLTVTGSHTYATAGNDTVKVMLSDDGTGTASATATTTATVSPATVVYDFNRDGKSDLLFQNTNATPQIWLMNGASIISQTQLPTPPSQWKIVTSADFNGDRLADLLWLNTGTNQPAIWEMNGTSIISAVGLPAPPSSWRIAGAGDLFGSGDAAIIWQNSDGTPAVWQMNGTSLANGVALPNPGPSWRIVATGDFNGDGRTDLLWDNIFTNQPAIWEMNGASIVSAVGLTAQPANMEIIGTGDFTGNGDADIVWLNTTTNAPTIWIMNGTSVVSTATLPAPPTTWRLVGTSDLYGTGKADILWQNANGDVSVWQMNGTSIVSALDAGNPGAPWILNNNDPPLPAAASGTTDGGGSLHLSMPDAANGRGATFPSGGR